MESLCSAKPWIVDPTILPIPWRKELASTPTRPLKIAFVFDDGVVKPQPPVERATREMAEKLRGAGHEGPFSSAAQAL
jgi:amidase